MSSKTLHRFGMLPRSVAPSLLFYGSDQAAFEAIAPILERLAHSDLRLETILSTSDPEVAHWLKQSFPKIRSVPIPYAIASATVLFLRQLRVRAVILLEQEAYPNETLFKCVKDKSISTVLLSGRGRAHLTFSPSPETGSDLRLVVDRETAKDVSLDDHVTLIPSTTGQCDTAATDAVMEQLVPLLGKNRKWINRRDRPLRRMFGRWLHRQLDQPKSAARLKPFVQRYDERELYEDLGSPQTILCLGNGPSSEHADLQEVSYDALFRVNHSWMNRSVLTDADVVFTGGYSSMRALKTPIFGLQHQTGEMLLLAMKGPYAFRHRLRYFSMERLGSRLTDFDWGNHRPTNGAAMIAMAVALQPKRLIIAGIDLFRHPDGSYPGDTDTPNAYTPAHSSDKELGFMFHHLDQFAGEVVIIGEILDREWRHHKERHRHHLDKVG